MKPESYSKTVELINELLDGKLSTAQTKELNELLRSSPEARDLYLEIASVHIGLERSHISGFEGVPSSLMLAKQPTAPDGQMIPRRLSRFGLSRLSMDWRMAICIACLIAVIVMATWITQSSSQLSTVPPDPPRYIATLILADNCQWESAKIHEGERLAEQVLKLLHGTAAIRFDGGTEMLFSSPTSIEIRTAESARLMTGEVTVRGTEGFKLSTSACDLIDLGTEFVASVMSTGKTELHVLSGQVALTSKRYDRGDQVIKEGNSVQIGPSQDQPQPIKGSNLGFQQLLEQTVSRTISSDLQAQESFNYPRGNLAPGELAGGSGWSSPWRLRSDAEYAPLHELKNPRLVDSNGVMHISNGTLIPQPQIPQSEEVDNSGRLSLPPGRHYRLRNLSTPIDMAADGITYFSLQFLQNGILPKNDPVESPSSLINADSFRITFRSSEHYWKESLLFGLRSNEFPIVHTFGSGFFDSMASVATDTPVLWTGKIIRHQAQEDEIYFRIFTKPEQLDVVEPSTWHVSTRGVYMDQSFDVMVLTSIGNADVEVDEIRIGQSWRSIAVWPRSD